MLQKSHYFKAKRRFDGALEKRDVRYREVSPEVLDQIKNELLAQKRIQTRKSVAAFVIAALLTIGIGYDWFYGCSTYKVINAFFCVNADSVSA